MPLTSHRIAKIAISMKTIAIVVAIHGCPTDPHSRYIFRHAERDIRNRLSVGVMTARAAVFDPWVLAGLLFAVYAKVFSAGIGVRTSLSNKIMGCALRPLSLRSPS
jgi:hypothetical protein